MIARSATLPERLAFYSQCNEAGCRVWTASKHPTGYGQLSWKGRTRKAHRLAWEAVNGPIPPGLAICHRCDNRACVNPAHMFLGTHADNQADKIAKGRQPRGRTHWRSKLTDEAIRAIRSDGRLQKDIAADYGIRPAHVSRIQSRVRWGHVE